MSDANPPNEAADSRIKIDPSSINPEPSHAARPSEGEARSNIDSVSFGFPDSELANDVANAFSTLEHLTPIIQSPTGICIADPDARAAGVWHGDFKIVRKVGQGGMGSVFEAEQLSMRRRVALKALPPLAALSEDERKRFRREARAAARLHHEHIVPVFGAYEDEREHFYAMRFIDGVPLSRIVSTLRLLIRTPQIQSNEDELLCATNLTLIRRIVSDQLRFNRRTPGTLESSEASSAATPDFDWSRAIGRDYLNAIARIGIDAAEALQYADSQGVIHGDVKPGNLLLDHNGCIWLTDFGLAVLRDSDATRPAHSYGGTPGYTSPEQVAADRPITDSRTDVYALGATLYELITLRRLPPNTPGMIAPLTITPPRRLNQYVPNDLETIILKSIEHEPADRYDSAQDLADDLRRFLQNEPIRAVRASIFARTRKFVLRHTRGVAIGVSVTVLALLVFASALLYFYRNESAHRQHAETSLATLHDLIQNTTLAAEDLLDGLPHGSSRVHSYFLGMERFYETAMERIPGASEDPVLRYRLALARYHVAMSFQALAGRDHRLIALGRANSSIELLDSAAINGELAAQVQYNQFRTLAFRANLHASLGDHAAALRDAAGAVAVAEALAQRLPENPDWRDAVAFAYYTLSTRFKANKQSDLAADAASKCLRIARELTSSPNAKPFYWNNVFRAVYTQAQLAEEADDLPSAEACFREALEINAKLQVLCPDQPHYPSERVFTQRALAGLLRNMGRFAEAVELLQAASAEALRLRDIYPYQRHYLEVALSTQAELASIFAAEGREDEALALADAVRADFQRMVELNPAWNEIWAAVETSLPTPSSEQR